MTIQERKAIPIPQVEPQAPIPQQNLRIPGPTTVPPVILAEMARPMINHRGPEFAAIMRRVTARLQYFFQTSSPVLTYPASGTGGQESTIANLFSPGDLHQAIMSWSSLSGPLATGWQILLMPMGYRYPASSFRGDKRLIQTSLRHA